MVVVCHAVPPSDPWFAVVACAVVGMSLVSCSCCFVAVLGTGLFPCLASAQTLQRYVLVLGDPLGVFLALVPARAAVLVRVRRQLCCWQGP